MTHSLLREIIGGCKKLPLIEIGQALHFWEIFTATHYCIAPRCYRIHFSCRGFSPPLLHRVPELFCHVTFSLPFPQSPPLSPLQLEVLLKAVLRFDVDSSHSSLTHLLIVTACLVECLHLPFKAKDDALGAKLKDDFKQQRGYFWLAQLILKLTFAPDSSPLPPALASLLDIPSYPSPRSPQSGRGKDGGPPSPSSSASVSPALIALLDTCVRMAQLVGPAAGAVDSSGNPVRPFMRSPEGSFRDLSALPGSALASLTALRIRDKDAVTVLQSVFVETGQLAVRLLLLERLHNFYAFLPPNYFALTELKVFPHLIRGMAAYPPVLQEQLLKVFEYTAVVLGVVPELELQAIRQELQQGNTPPSLAVASLKFLSKLLSFDQHYSDVLRATGLLEVILADLRRACAAHGNSNSSNNTGTSGSSTPSSIQSPSSLPSPSSLASSSASADPSSLSSADASQSSAATPPSFGRVHRGARADMSMRAMALRASALHDSSAAAGLAAAGAQPSLFVDPSRSAAASAAASAAWQCLLSLVTRSPGNQKVLKQQRVVPQVLPLLTDAFHRPYVLRLLHIVISEDVTQVGQVKCRQQAGRQVDVQVGGWVVG